MTQRNDNSWKYLTIIKAPDFPAPDFVKEALVGLPLRIYAKCISEPKPGEATQLITGKPVSGYLNGYAVEQPHFLEQLGKKNLKAYLWFVENKFPQQRFFIFKHDECSETPELKLADYQRPSQE